MTHEPRKYRTIPQTVEAMLFDGTLDCAVHILGWLHSHGQEAYTSGSLDYNRVEAIQIGNEHTYIRASKDHFVIVTSELDIMIKSRALFESTYESFDRSGGAIPRVTSQEFIPPILFDPGVKHG